jgi:DNA helicase IV
LNTVIKTIEEMIVKGEEEDRRKRNDPDLPGNSLTSKRIRDYQYARKSLYFGKVDIINEEGNEETYYTGEYSIAKDETDIIIYNWASTFGDAFCGSYGGNGTITYEVENKNGMYKNTLTVLLKRQLEIKKDKVLDYSDLQSDQALKRFSSKNIKNNKNTLPTKLDEDDQYFMLHEGE